NGCTSSFFDVFLEMKSGPEITDVTLLSSTDQATWTAVSGDLASGYSMCINPATPFHYLDINTLTGPVNPLTGAFAQNAFTLDVTSVPAGFYAYWAAKGVVSGASEWQGVMWNIINGTAPMFYINYTGTDYQLIDGMQYQYGGVAQTLRITGDYPQGNYKFTGSVTDINGCVSSFFDVFLEMNTVPAPPVLSNVVQPTCTLATGSVVLTGLPSGNWTINPGNITGSGATTTIADLVPGTYSYTVNNGYCTSDVSADIIINTQPVTPAAPVVGAITHPTCIILSSVDLSGLPVSSWVVTATPGGSQISGNTSTATFTGLPGGNTYLFTVTLLSSGCTSASSGPAVINAVPGAPPAPTAGTITQPTCSVATGSVVLSGLPAGNWTINPGNITGTGSSTTITNLTAGTYNYSVTNDLGCTSSLSSDIVINTQPVTPAAPIIGIITQPTCTQATGNVVLNGLPSGNWTINPGNITGTGTTKLITGLVAGTYNFTVNNGSCTSVASADVVINTQPV
ncbi:MAG: hypothetical protein KAZ36_02780, partial [Bacteroidales bacterium]|nr:hypothetical protein [Bacteroidales bacterium]